MPFLRLLAVPGTRPRRARRGRRRAVVVTARPQVVLPDAVRANAAFLDAVLPDAVLADGAHGRSWGPRRPR